MEYKWKEPIDIPDGKHSGVITKILERTDPYEYTDLFIKPEGQEVELKYGCPSNLTENSKLGRLVLSFGFKPIINQVITTNDLIKLFVGRKVEFLVMKKKTKDGKEFSEIVEDSLKPILTTEGSNFNSQISPPSVVKV